MKPSRTTVAAVVLLFLVLAPPIPAPAMEVETADMQTNETSAVGSVRSLNTALVFYQKGHANEGFAVTLADLGPQGADLLDQSLVSGRKNGYLFVLLPGRTDGSGKVTGYTVLARPQVYSRTGKLTIYTDESGKIRGTRENRDATAKDTPL